MGSVLSFFFGDTTRDTNVGGYGYNRPKLTDYLRKPTEDDDDEDEEHNGGKRRRKQSRRQRKSGNKTKHKKKH